MKKRICCYLLFCLNFLLLSACISDSANEQKIGLMYDFKEPINFPFEVNDVSTAIDVQQVEYLHQFVFHYRNQETTQEIKYILSKIIEEPKDNEVTKDDKTEYKLNNGVSAFYEEKTTSQSLWWENEDGFLARYVYYINGNTSNLGEYKLEIKELIDLANQVQ